MEAHDDIIGQRELFDPAINPLFFAFPAGILCASRGRWARACHQLVRR
jgi:hypothetical protein